MLTATLVQGVQKIKTVYRLSFIFPLALLIQTTNLISGTEFLKPVILNIPHYANTLPSLCLSLKATDSEQDIHTDWDNILLPSNHAANSVAVKVDHF